MTADGVQPLFPGAPASEPTVSDGEVLLQGTLTVAPDSAEAEDTVRDLRASLGDEALVGGNCGVYEGTVVKRRTVLAAGTILTRSTPVYDLVRETVHRADGDTPLIVPEGAVVVPGSRAVAKGAGKDWGLSLYTPVIVKYRDAGTDERVQLEDWLR